MSETIPILEFKTTHPYDGTLSSFETAVAQCLQKARDAGAPEMVRFIGLGVSGPYVSTDVGSVRLLLSWVAPTAQQSLP